jgi:CBS-domain-containing membrane protein
MVQAAAMKRRLLRYAIAWIAVIVALGAATFLLGFTHHTWLLASLGGSCVILFGMPETEMAQPRSFLGGHVISTAVGLAFLRYGFHAFGGPQEIWVIASVATALILMMATRTIHSPAGGNPIIVFYEGAGWSFLLTPLAIGLLVLLATALLFNRGGLAKTYPQRWW